MNPPIGLEHYYFQKIFFEVNPDFDQKKIAEQIPLPQSVAKIQVMEGGPLQYRIELKVTLDPKGPYLLEIITVGIIHVAKEVPEDKREGVVGLNGCSVLYGAVREQLMMLTSRSLYGMICLPAVMFGPIPPPQE